MLEKYDLKKMLEEIKDDEKVEEGKIKILSQENIKQMVQGKRGKGKGAP